MKKTSKKPQNQLIQLHSRRQPIHLVDTRKLAHQLRRYPPISQIRQKHTQTVKQIFPRAPSSCRPNSALIFAVCLPRRHHRRCPLKQKSGSSCRNERKLSARNYVTHPAAAAAINIILNPLGALSTQGNVLRSTPTPKAMNEHHQYVVLNLFRPRKKCHEKE